LIQFTNFYKGKHGDVAAYPTTEAVMLQFAGQDLTNYFPMPMNLACPELVPSDQLSLMRANFTPVVAYAVHTSGALQTIPDTKLDAGDWYTNRLMPSLKDMYKGDFVYDKAYVRNEADGSER
jgi:chitin synthase